MKILQIANCDSQGGADKVAWSHMNGFRQRGHEAHLLVNKKTTDDPDVVLMDDLARPGAWTTFWRHVGQRAQHSDLFRRSPRPARLIEYVARPRAAVEGKLGLEDFQYPATWQILSYFRPDIIHIQNPHTRYFDLRVLPYLSEQVPTFVSLHDDWFMTGHCSSTFQCTRWQTGCGHCPDLWTYPAIQRDATAYNAKRKQTIYSRSRLYVVTATEWQRHRAEQSIIADNIHEARVIPNGIDLTIFCEGDKQAARATLGLPSEAKVLLFAAVNFQKNRAKDYVTLRGAIETIGQWRPDNDFVLVSIGQNGEQSIEQIGNIQVRLLPYERDPQQMAKYYQAADAYVHAARADTFPTVILEAMACGTPVVATSIGGIPEQITTPEQSPAEANGVLAALADPADLAQGILRLLENDDLRLHLAANALRTAQKRFNIDRQLQAMQSWYEEAMRSYAAEPMHKRSMAHR